MLPELAKHQKDGINRLFHHLAWATENLEPVLDAIPEKPDKAYLDHLNAASSGNGFLFAWAMGAGKTRAALTAMQIWDGWVDAHVTQPALHNALRRPMLVIGEASGIHVWANQYAQWFPEGDQNFIVSARTGKDIDPCMDALVLGKARACTVSYSLLTRHIDRFAELPWSLCVLDEIQAITNQDAERSRALHRLMRYRPDGTQGLAFRLGLSGTPFTNQIGSLWPVLATLQGYTYGRTVAGKQVYTLRSGIWGNRVQFADAYTYNDGKSIKGHHIVHGTSVSVSCAFHKEEDCEHLHPRMKRWIMHRVGASEAWPNLPGVSLIWRETKMGTEQAKLYADLVDNYIIPAVSEKGSSKDIAIHQMALMTYAFEALASGNQIAYSLRNKDAGASLRFGSNASCVLDEVRLILSEMENNEKAIVFTGFEQFAMEIARHPDIAKLNPILLTGNSGWSSERAEREFQAPGSKHRVLISTTKGIKAITLTAARYCLIAGFLSYSPWDILQAIYRIRRPSQQAEHLMVYGISVEHSLLQWLQGRLATKLEYGLRVLDGAEGGAEELGIGHLTNKQFADAFWGM